MKICALCMTALLVLAINVSAKKNNFKSQEVQFMVNNKNQTHFDEAEEFWFADDYGRPVKAVLDKPATYDFGLISMENNVFFYLYTRDSDIPDSLYVNDIFMLKKSHFNPSRETKIITHGWVNSKNSRACRLVRDAYLIHGDYNIIVVDWSKITMRPYRWAVTQVKPVAQYVAQMIDFLEIQKASLDTMTLVGHSLGAHVLGLAGYHAKGTVNYLVGLDPALPSFGKADPGERISAEDARNVEIIHTNAGVLGYVAAIGTADFYPNGGAKQASCEFDLGGHCSHCRSFEYFAESINTPVGFYGRKCSYFKYLLGMCDGELGLMGSVRSSLPYNGTYYFKTREVNPFANGS